MVLVVFVVAFLAAALRDAAGARLLVVPVDLFTREAVFRRDFAAAVSLDAASDDCEEEVALLIANPFFRAKRGRSGIR